MVVTIDRTDSNAVVITVIVIFVFIQMVHGGS